MNEQLYQLHEWIASQQRFMPRGNPLPSDLAQEEVTVLSRIGLICCLVPVQMPGEPTVAEIATDAVRSLYEMFSIKEKDDGSHGAEDWFFTCLGIANEMIQKLEPLIKGEANE